MTMPQFSILQKEGIKRFQSNLGLISITLAVVPTFVQAQRQTHHQFLRPDLRSVNSVRTELD